MKPLTAARSLRMSPARFAALLVVLLWPPTAAIAVCSGDVYDEFGPMVGNWDLRADTDTIGTVEVRADDAGCSMQRTFRIGSETAQSYLFIDPADGRLNELVIDQDGGLFRLAGTRQDGQWRLRGTFTDNAGNRARARVTIESLDGGGFRETLDIENESEWGRVFDFRFGTGSSNEAEPDTRMTSSEAAPPRAAPARPERSSTPAPAPAAESERIRVSSGSESPTSMRGQEVSKIVVDSPMLVDLQLGPIDKLPDGYSWSSRDLARYEIGGATIERVEVQRRTRRGKSTLLITLFGTSENFTDELDISIEVVDANGNSLSDVGNGRLYVGRSIPQQIAEGATSLKIELSTRTEELNAALASGERPKLAIEVVERN